MGIWDVTYYSLFLTLGLSFIAVTEGMGNRIATGYGVLLVLTLGLLFVIEEWLVTLFGLPETGVIRFSYLYGMIYAGYGYWLAYIASGGKAGPSWTRPALFTVLGACAAALISLTLPLDQVPVLLFNILLVGMIISNGTAAMTWKTSEGKVNPSAGIALGTAGMLSLILLGATLLGGWDPTATQWIFRGSFAIVALLTILTVSYALFDMRRSHADALRERLMAVELQASQASELLRLERAYSEAQSEIIERTRRLSDVSHDLRQPIASIRAELDASALPDEPRERLRRLADHLYDLSDGYVGGSAGHGLPSKDEGNALSEDISLTAFFATLRHLFESDAEQAGIDLRMVSSARAVFAPATPLMRVVSNLATNAISHSGAERILVGAKRRGGAIAIVVADNGRGLSEAELEAAFRRGEKSADSEGSGLGLPIVRSLTKEFGFGLENELLKGGGLLFAITVPAAREQ
ncbi:hypothetical protein HK107_13180 [Parvularcula sp. ZS-1/3]|uniref:histidine kinase n=1 Tax=Parvularcula mediterranea TaxID=2732508 RepID=A0A7Y3RQ14_9PROT|nr:ATP-binding protein [Parvularcula mediterranea]NNU17277.1 hypothetical protein [Parvularcula mediterranea]